MERVMDRAFSKAHGAVHAVTGAAAAAVQQQQRSKEDELRSLSAPMTAADVVPRIALAFADGDYFRLLQLPGPRLNELGRAEWPVSGGELSRAYRKLSILVHPDKNPGPEARQAFEQLKQAYNELRDTDKLAARLREAEPALQRAAERAAATASVSERVELNAAAGERKAKLRQQEARSFQAEIQEQMKRRAAEAALKKQRALSSRSQQREGGSGSGSDVEGGGGSGRRAGGGAARGGRQERGGRGSGSSSSSEEEEYVRSKAAKRKKPRFM